jgi:hypothetical protein
MGSRERLQAGDPDPEATTPELWAAGELLPDEQAQGGAALAAAIVTGLMVALAAFFVAFAPPA